MTEVNERALFHKRQCSRRLALQALYQWKFTEEEVDTLVKQYQEDEYWPKSDHEYFAMLVSGTIHQVDKIDVHINSVSDYLVEKIDPIELSALRLAVYELFNCLQVPENVITAEYIRLCKKFGSEEGFRLVNAILDKLIKQTDRKNLLLKN